MYLCPDAEADGFEEPGLHHSQIRPKIEAEGESGTTILAGKRGSPSSKPGPSLPTGVSVKREASQGKEDSEADLTAALLSAAAAQSSSSLHQVRSLVALRVMAEQMNRNGSVYSHRSCLTFLFKNRFGPLRSTEVP